MTDGRLATADGACCSRAPSPWCTGPTAGPGGGRRVPPRE